MFRQLINYIYSCTSNNAAVEPQHDPNKVKYNVYEVHDPKETFEIRYDKLDEKQFYNDYLTIMSKDLRILSLQESADLRENDPLYVAIKGTLVGAFFASSAAYPGNQYNLNTIHKFFLESTPDNFISSGVDFFMYLKRYYGPNSSKLIIFNMMKNHQEMMKKVEQIAFQLTTIITNNPVILTKNQIEDIIRVRLTNYYDGKETEETIDLRKDNFIEGYFSKSFISSESYPISQEMLNKLNNAHLIAKCLMLQFLLDCWKIEDLAPETYEVTLVKSINTLLNTLGLDSSFTAETLKITDVDILETEKQEEKEDEAVNIDPYSREIILEPEHAEVKNPETTHLSLKIVDKEPTNSTISKTEELQKPSEKPVELTQLSGFLGPDNDPDSCAIDISYKTIGAKPEDSYMFEWIKIIEAKDVREYLLSLASIQNLQNATVKMQAQASHIQKTDWSIDFSSRAPSDNNHYQLEPQAKVSLHSCELQQSVLDYM